MNFSSTEMDTANRLKHKIVSDVIRDRILTNRLEPGDRLPSEQQLARELGFAHLTVRRGLAELVSEELIEKRHGVGSFVREIRPGNTTIQIAVVMPEWMYDTGHKHPYASLIINGVNRALDQRKYSVSVLSYRFGRCWFDAGQVAAKRGIRGVILCPYANISRNEVQQFLDAEIKVSLLSDIPRLAGMGLGRIKADTTMAVTQIMNRLLDLGHRRVAAPLSEYKGLLQTICREAGVGPFRDIMLDIANPFAAGKPPDYSVMSKVLGYRPRPTAVIVRDEFSAAEMFRLCYARELRVPRDMSIAALCDNTPYIHPVPLTAPDTVRLNTQIAEMAARYLARLLAGEQPLESEIHLRCDVQWKASVGPMRKVGGNG